MILESDFQCKDFAEIHFRFFALFENNKVLDDFFFISLLKTGELVRKKNYGPKVTRQCNYKKPIDYKCSKNIFWEGQLITLPLFKSIAQYKIIANKK